MKESARASSLAEQVAAVERVAADLEREKEQLTEKYSTCAAEVRQLRILFNRTDAYVPLGVGSTAKRLPGSTGALRADDVAAAYPASRAPGGFGADTAWNDAPAAAAALGPPRGVAARPQDSAFDRFRQGLVSDDVVLWDDDTLQIGLKAAYMPGEGRAELEVYFGNKQAGGLYSFDTRYVVDATDQSAIQVRASTVGPSLGGRIQIIQKISVQVRAPFQSSPTCHLSFLLADSTPRSLQFRLPIAVWRFMTPLTEVEPEEFFREWRREELASTEVARICIVAQALRGALSSLARAVCGPGLGFLTGIDTNPRNIVAAGRWAGPPLQGLMPIVLVRLELGQGEAAGKLRLAVRSEHTPLALGVRNAIILQVEPRGNEAS